MPILTRREILKSAAATATLTILPHWTHGAGPNDKLNTAHIGVGGMGSGDLTAIARHPNVNVVALCDVDSNALAAAAKKFPKARTFANFRVMFDQLADKIDAVSVSTPDHTHAPAAMRALNLGKHVYCQKPLTHEVFEARRLREVAEEKKLVTQMGVQVHASREYRIATQIIQEGVIGKIREVHAWSSKNWGYDGGPITSADTVPANLNWDLWLGTANQRAYKAGVYHPQNWRKMIDFGTGSLGDMGVHIFDTPYRALKLTAPIWVKTNCRPPTNVGQPERNLVEYEFPGTEYTTKTLRWHWYDGANAPPSGHYYPLHETHKLPDQGAIFLGDKGSCLLPHVGLPQLFPQKDFAGFQFPEIDRLDHYHQWVDACLGKTKTSAHFGYAGPLTEALLLGVVANRFPAKKLHWDAANLKMTNLADANDLIRRTYRKGFEVEHL